MKTKSTVQAAGADAIENAAGEKAEEIETEGSDRLAERIEESREDIENLITALGGWAESLGEDAPAAEKAHLEEVIKRERGALEGYGIGEHVASFKNLRQAAFDLSETLHYKAEYERTRPKQEQKRIVAGEAAQAKERPAARNADARAARSSQALSPVRPKQRTVASEAAKAKTRAAERNARNVEASRKNAARAPKHA